MTRLHKRLLVTVYLCFVVPTLCVMAQHPYWKQFSPADGLPGHKVYDILQARNGLLWFTTEQGVCNFNGYTFQQPVDTSYQGNAPAFKIFEDTQGRIWFNRLDAKLYVVEQDTVRAWKFNYLLDQLKEKFMGFGSFAVDIDGTVWLSLLNLGFLAVAPNGAPRELPGTSNNACLFTTIQGQSVASSAGIPPWVLSEKAGSEVNFYRWQHEKLQLTGTFKLKQATLGKYVQLFSLELKNGDFVLGCQETYYLLHHNQLEWQGQKKLVGNAFFETQDGSIMLSVLQGENQGLLRFRSPEDFKRNRFDNLLPGHAVVKMIADREGGWWVATTDGGLFYCKNPALEIIDKSNGLAFNNVETLAEDGRETIYAGMNPSRICAINQKNGQVVPLPPMPLQNDQALTFLRYDSLHGRLWGGGSLCYLKNDHWENVCFQVDNSDQLHKPLVKKINTDPSGKCWWASAPFGFFSIDLAHPKVTLVPSNASAKERTFSVTPDADGNLWVTTFQGLQRWKNGKYEPAPFHHPALRHSPQDLKILSDGTMAFVLQSAGLLLRDKNGQWLHLTEDDGLCSNAISKLNIGGNGDVLYACSNNGLNILRRKPDGAWGIQTLTVKHGIPSNLVNDVAELKREIWIATDQGIARVKELPVAAPMPPPELETFRVNNLDLHFSQNIKLAYDQDNIVLRFFALHFRSGGDILYKYRFDGTNTIYGYTRARELSFVQLPPGKYHVEVQAEDENGHWSDSANWYFDIIPAWWATWWFRALAGLVAAAVILLFFSLRIRNIRRQNRLQEKMRALQKAALRAQINPHFIFNCLASIQHFISENEVPAATRYLSRFARLVRLTLYGSLDGAHALTDEVEMLDNYLALEQLRFRDKFSYEIQADPSLLEEHVQIPPMLIQPFVENAIIHGMKNKAKGGLITVAFSKKQETLSVSISDNGQGFDHSDQPGSPDAETNHRSVGITLTQSRLELLASSFSREMIRAADGSIIGSKVTILLPLGL